ncbi:MAG: hypothetical protein ACJ72Z_07920 [Pyrinomonadaceae bacterium]
MRNCLILLILAVLGSSVGCASEEKPATPLETFKTYTRASKKKDITTMKLLLSSETLKMHEQEAKSQGITVDDILKREALLSENQTTVEFRNETIDGDKATLEVKDPMGFWQTVHFVRENGEWKIDKKGTADELIRQVEEENRKADEEFNSNRPFEGPTGSPTPPFEEPSRSPVPPLDTTNINRARR